MLPAALIGIDTAQAVDLSPAGLARGRHLSVEIERLGKRAAFLERKAARLPQGNGKRKASAQAAAIRQTVTLMREQASR